MSYRKNTVMRARWKTAGVDIWSLVQLPSDVGKKVGKN